jgi:hypothetical protein
MKEIVMTFVVRSSVFQNLVAPVLLVAALAATAAAQPPLAAEPEHPITAAQRREAIAQLAAALEQHYVFADKGRALGQALRTHLARGNYDALVTGERFARAVTAELTALVHDKHLELRYVDAPVPAAPPSAPAASDAEEAAEQRYLNYGVFEARRLKLNLGYLSFHVFGRPTALAGDKIAAAMRLVADTAGLIVDLRDCHGGDTDTVALAESYLVPAKTHLLDMYTRDDNSTEHVHAATDLPAPRYVDRPVVILIGDTTASGCEAFAYAMQSQRRATLIGGPTAGAAYFGSPRRITDHFMAFVPVGRPIDPITHGDWEGGGVTPAVAAPPDRALDAGELSLLRALAPREPSPRRQAAMQKRIAELAPH